MKVPTTKVPKEVLASGTVRLSNCAVIDVNAEDCEAPRIKIDDYYFDAKASREAAAFFINLARVLDGKSQA